MVTAGKRQAPCLFRLFPPNQPFCTPPDSAHMSAVFVPSPADQSRARCADLLSQLRPLLAAPSANATTAFRSAHEELKCLPPEIASLEATECLLLIAHYFYLAAQPVLGLAAATQSSSFARLIKNPTLLRRALSLRGLMFVETGNLPRHGITTGGT